MSADQPHGKIIFTIAGTSKVFADFHMFDFVLPFFMLFFHYTSAMKLLFHFTYWGYLMKNRIFIACISTLTLAAGCTMFTAWKSIPPPGGCDQCHTQPISNNWQLAYKAPVLSDEKDRKYFQTEKYNLPPAEKPTSSLEVRKVADENCFECHRTPTPAHKGRMGRFHH